MSIYKQTHLEGLPLTAGWDYTPNTMPLEAIFTLVLLIATLVVLSAQWLRADLTALLVMLALIISGILSPAEAFSAFGQPVILIVASVFVIGAALFETGVATLIANQILRFGSRGETMLLFIIILAAAGLTAFLDGLLVVALLLPAVLRVARQANLAPSRLLMPLAMTATVGNQLTLIGTTSNLVVSDILAGHSQTRLGLFSLTPYALVSVGILMVWYMLMGRRFLRRELPSEPQRPSLAEVQQSYQLNKQLYRLRVRSNSDLIAQSLEASGKVWTAARIKVMAIQAKGAKLEPARPECVLEQDDLLIVEGDVGRILQVASAHELESKGAMELDEFNQLQHGTLRLAEVMVPFRSPLVGKSLAQVGFRHRYGLNILAVHRQGQVIRDGLSTLTLAAGDTLLVQGLLSDLRDIGRDLSLVPVTDLGPQPGDLITGKARLTLAVLGVMLILVVSGLASLGTASVLAAVVLILSKCLSPERAYQSVNWSLLVLIGGMLPLSMALQKTGAAEMIAQVIVGLSQNMGVLGSLVIFHLLTSLIAQVIGGAVGAALFTPIALSLAVAQGAPPEPFAIATAFAVLAGYVTPLTDGDNLLVREPGQYTMRDYVINGLPIFVLQTVALMSMLAFIYRLG
ncbi:MAG: SLC13 family permease [Chloroflexota bacterium]|nr:MAG: SLC13 family permease [Chloroflexota bacterium]